MSANSARRRRVRQQREQSQQWREQSVAELDRPCQLHELTHPRRRPEVFREGVRIVLDLEAAIAEGVCHFYNYVEPLTYEEAMLAEEKALACTMRRAREQCALINSVNVDTGLVNESQPTS